MPGKVKVKIIAGKNLPVMDRSSDTTDAYVEIKLGGTTYKTDVCRKSLHPQWNSEWYRFELDDSDLQDEPLQMRLMDHDTYSANDAIGKVYLDLNPLLLPTALMKYGMNSDSNKHDNPNNSVFSGWIPVYDTMHGIRGEVNVIVKVELFSDLNKYRQSSCGVQFFNSPTVPYGYCARTLYGFVEELVVSDDPEYQWIDKIRTPRASNEARQTLFFKLSGELRRKIGVKALEFGANSVIGYRQSFDLEGESGIVARGIGTAAFLVKVVAATDSTLGNDEYNSSQVQDLFHLDHHRSESVGTKISQSPSKNVNISCRRSSDSDISITPKGNSLPSSDRLGCIGHVIKPTMLLRSVTQQDNFDMLEYPFLTISKYPSGFISYLGGSVSARSVKLLERNSNMEEPELRDAWWSELRMEIRSHARSLNCNAVLGYAETSSICEDVCILSASGTAAVIGVPHTEIVDNIFITTAQDTVSTDKYENKKIPQKEMHSKNPMETEENTPRVTSSSSCIPCHLPYNANLSLESSNIKCALCRNGMVPEVLITTIEPPEGIQTIGLGCFLHASVYRSLKELKGESNAKEISDGLPFLEYELHRILVNKMKMKGMNAIFCLKIQISIGERVLLGTATGTAVFLAALYSPSLLKLTSDRTVDNKKIADLQKRCNDIVKKNKEVYQLKNIEEIQAGGGILVDNELAEEMSSLELNTGNKEFCLLEVDDPDDPEIRNLLTEEYPPNGIHVVSTELVTGLEEMEIVKNLQMFKQIYRCKIQYPFGLNQHFQKLLQCVFFKMRRMIPCAVCDLQFAVNLPETDEIQITVLGMILGLGDVPKVKTKKKTGGPKNDDLIFNIEGVDVPEKGALLSSNPVNSSSLTTGKKLPCTPTKERLHSGKQEHTPYKERHGVDISPLSYIPGAKVERYLGNLNFFLIRETTSIREEGGLCAFVHSFATEILAIVRAHITALGGNGMVSYFMKECILNYNLHKNQGQCLINVGGDVVSVSYFIDD